MRYHSIIHLVLSLLPTVLQAQTLEQKIADKLCDCFMTIDQSKEQDTVFEKYEQECLPRAFEGFETEIEKIADTIQADTDYDRGLKFGRTIGVRSQVLMIKRCDAFFYFMDSLRNGLFRNVSVADERANISSKSALISIGPSVTNYFDRAMSYFKIQDFQLAKKDLDKIVEMDSNFGAGYLLRAFLYEQTKKYKRAIADYEVSKKLTGKSEIDMFMAMAQRKSEHKR